MASRRSSPNLVAGRHANNAAMDEAEFSNKIISFGVSPNCWYSMLVIVHGKKAVTPQEAKTVKSLAKLWEADENLLYSHDFEKSVCPNLLQAMEIDEEDESDKELIQDEQQDQELVTLPKEWVYTYSSPTKVDRASAILTTEKTMIESNDTLMVEEAESQSVMMHNGEGDQSKTGEQEQGASKESRGELVEEVVVKKRTQKWGPALPERRSKRHPLDGVPVLEKAQALKKKSNLEVTEEGALAKM